MHRKALIVLVCLMSLPAWAQRDLPGPWMTADNGGVVTLAACGTKICGTVEGITGFRPNGATPVDINGRSRCHLQIIADLVQDEPGSWSGHITNPDDGKTYSINVSLDPAGRLRLRGYIGIPLLGRTTIWTRYTGKLTPDCHLVSG
jgi:uncharacterized protein (DUF2147 family)